MRIFETGELIQFYTPESTYQDGEVVAVIPSKIPYSSTRYWQLTGEEQKDMHPTATVKWLDGTQSDIDMFDLDPRDSELERQFRVEASPILKEINMKINKAQALLTEATQLSEKHGIPFRASISPLSQSYFPQSFSHKFSDIDSEIVTEITGAWSDYPEDGGWQHSAVC